MTNTFIKDMRSREPRIGDVYIGNSSKGPDIIILLHCSNWKNWTVMTKRGIREMLPDKLETFIYDEDILLHAAFNMRIE